MSDIEEASKATAEIAKFLTKALDSGDKFGGFISKMFGYPIEEVVGTIGDKLKCVRVQRLIRMEDEISKLLEERGLSNVRAIPPKFAIPMIENSSMEEDDELQDIWCKLIANGLDPNFDSEIRFAYIDMIRNITSLDAKILNLFYDIKAGKKSEGTLFRILTDEMNCRNQACNISMYNLMRLQCIERRDIDGGGADDEVLDEVNYIDKYFLTPLGIAFIEACIK